MKDVGSLPEDETHSRRRRERLASLKLSAPPLGAVGLDLFAQLFVVPPSPEEICQPANPGPHDDLSLSGARIARQADPKVRLYKN